jgi:hypothetical protein
MKNYIKHILFLLVTVGLLQSCSDGDKTVDYVFDNITRGATLKTIATVSPTFDFGVPSSEWSVLVEFRDHEGGTSLSEVEVYVTHVGVNGSSPEVLVKTIPASDFTGNGPAPESFPQGEVKASLGETLAALGYGDDDYTNTDQFRMRLVVVLKDGRRFTNDASGQVTGGSFFSSPFAYSAQFFCVPTDASLFDGNWVVVTDTWADYEPGETVPLIPDPDIPLAFRILSTNNPYIGNPGTSYMLCTIDPTDGSISVQSNEPFDYGVDVPVTGSGSIGTCTGDITIDPLTFGNYGDWVFTLVKE